jgi:hypothetical protein
VEDSLDDGALGVHAFEKAVPAPSSASRKFQSA